jgi:hypothetical protein
MLMPIPVDRPRSGYVRFMRWVLIAPLATLAVTALSACAIAPPQPWERGALARPAMSMSADPLEQRFDQHIYGSKENASGGYGVGGGGCGCN